MTALDRSLTDRARAITREQIGPFIEGEPDVEETTTDWFPASLRIDVATEGEEPLAQRAVSATLLCAPDADLDGRDAVEVESDPHGRRVWEIDGAPLALLRGRRRVAWRARLRTYAGRDRDGP